MKKKIVLIVAVVLVLSMVLFGCTTSDVTVDADVNLLKNGNFEKNGTDWTFKNSGTAEPSFTNIDPAASSYDAVYGRSSLYITDSDKTTVFTATQTLAVQPHSVYELSMDYKITSEISVATGGKGAYLQLQGLDFMVASATDVTDGWQKWRLYFNSDNYDEVTVLFGMGEADYVAQSGTVYFDNVSLVRLNDEAAAGVAAISLSAGSRTRYDAAYRHTVPDTVYMVLVVVLSVALLLAGYCLLKRLSKPKETEVQANGVVKGASILQNSTLLLVVTLLVGFAIRLVLCLTLYGYGAYENALMTNTATMVENGIGNYYYNYSTFYAPGTMYTLYILGAIAAPLRLTAGTQGMAIFLKIPALIADLVIIALVYLVVDKRKGSIPALVSALLLALCPVLFMASSLWGVYTSVGILFMLLTFMAVRNRQVIKMTIFYYFAVQFMEEALLVLPLLLVYAVLLYIKYPETRIKLPVCFTAAFVVGYCVTIPLAINYYVAGHPFIVLERYFTVYNANAYFARNIFNIYGMCAVSAESVNTAGVVMGAIFAAAGMLGGIALYLKNRNRQDILLYSAWTFAVIYTLCVRMNLWVLMTALVMLYLYALYTDEKRLMWVAGAYSTIAAVNACYVMFVGGNVQGGVGAAGVTIGSLDPVMIIFSVFSVLTLFGFTYVVADICLGRKKLMMPFDSTPYEWWAAMTKKLRKNADSDQQ